MIIHIGDNLSLFKKDILVILDKNSVESSKDTSNFIMNLINKGALVNTITKNIKTYIVTIERDKESKLVYKLYVSNISTNSLINRKIANDWR